MTFPVHRPVWRPPGYEASPSSSANRRAAASRSLTPYRIWSIRSIALCLQRLFDGGAEGSKASLDVGAEVDAEGAALAVGEHLEIAARLGRLHHPEGVAAAGHGQVGVVVARDLQEDAAI